MATWKRLTRDAPEGPIDVNMEKVALIEREKNRSYTLLIFACLSPFSHRPMIRDSLRRPDK
jgi:hypothetical protein